MIDAPRVSRRNLLLAGAAVGGGLAIGINPLRWIAVLAAETFTGNHAMGRDPRRRYGRRAHRTFGDGAGRPYRARAARGGGARCDWNKVTWEYPTPAENLARDRVWGDFETGGSYSIWGSHERLRKAGAAARTMLVQAAANGWNVPAAECTVDKGVISHRAWDRKTTYGSVARAAARLDVPKDVALKDSEGLEDHRQVAEATRHGRQADRQADLRRRSEVARHAERGDQGVPGVRWQGEKHRFVVAEHMPGVKKILRVGDAAVAVVADTWWHANAALDAVRIEWDAGENAEEARARLSADRNADDGLIGGDRPGNNLFSESWSRWI